ncbi:TPA: hypothetical protein I7730_16395 [Vibrio vulnificus]|uniref:Uncharacterized protein n=1 Tax=Vibrio vulnificus TaxID=672 RepID=A0A8H9N208_VIBVL|nr:hypothetical protein [Vibrio vulnificus]HAS8541365.1 hypothetical protein [Vibrio vulnificus]
MFKGGTLALALLATSPAFASGDPVAAASIGKEISALMILIYAVSILLGLKILLTIVFDVLNWSRFSQEHANSMRVIVVKAAVAAVLLSPQASIMMISNTLGFSSSMEEPYCFAYTNKLGQNDFKSLKFDGTDSLQGDGNVSKCYETASSNYISELKNKMDDAEKNRVEAFLNGNARIVIAIFQVIAAYFYFSAWYTIMQISNGTERQSTYGKQIVIIIVSSGFLNLPHLMLFVSNIILTLRSALGLG